MAAATADREGTMRPVHGLIQDERIIPVAAATTIYRYTMVSVNASGQLIPAADDVGQNGKAVWFALQGADNSAGVAGAASIRVMVEGTAYMDTGALTAAAVGTIAHAIDDSTLATTSTQSREVGIVLEWGADRTAVKIG